MRDITSPASSNTTVLACDVGGTNTSCALVSLRGKRFSVLRRFRYDTQSLSTLEDAVLPVMDELRQDAASTAPAAVCISGAGPVKDNRCHLTNVSWTIEGTALAERLGMPVTVINDFTAISYGIPLLDTHNPEAIMPLTRGYTPERDERVRAVVGAGTGLGVGYVVDHLGEYLALPSEGGHAVFSPYNEITRELFEFVRERGQEQPGAESFVSGRGIGNTLEFFQNTGRITPDSPLSLPLPPDTEPARYVSECARAGDTAAREIMELFVENYARVSSDAALHFLPFGGLYLAGGIVTKNEEWFLRGDRFMRSFLISYRDNIGEMLHRVPVYIVRDYGVSLYGAAYGASLVLKEKHHG